MKAQEFLQYHASEGGLIDAEGARELLEFAGLETSGLDLSALADEANAIAISDAKAGRISGTRLFTAEDGYTFAEMACGTITDGDMEWPNEAAFTAAMRDHGITVTVERIY